MGTVIHRAHPGSLQALAISARDDLSINMGNHDWKFGGLNGSK
jgi:hypothetical protein